MTQMNEVLAEVQKQIDYGLLDAKTEAKALKFVREFESRIDYGTETLAKATIRYALRLRARNHDCAVSVSLKQIESHFEARDRFLADYYKGA